MNNNLQEGNTMKRQQLKDTDYPSHIHFSFTQRFHILFKFVQFQLIPDLFIIEDEISSAEAMENRVFGTLS
ncbi:hypothetical protein T03_8824 [Trichinella britovi]|uniref:Uncharacterized protein n=1 Tax=Trichinella britovi TaxID=45882 RepID=A0A0V1CG07_TRIBR|nr:hypothetical protein T03_8824 [Trichinella britovi]